VVVSRRVRFLLDRTSPPPLPSAGVSMLVLDRSRCLLDAASPTSSLRACIACRAASEPSLFGHLPPRVLALANDLLHEPIRHRQCPSEPSTQLRRRNKHAVSGRVLRAAQPCCAD